MTMTDIISDQLNAALFDFSLYRLQVSNKAFELLLNLNRPQTLPELFRFFPQTIEQAEVQEFNLSCTVPQRIDNHEELISMWMLEKDCLDRAQVANWLSVADSLHRQVLYRIACQICSIEAGQSYIAGLKFFLPVTGFWGRCFEDQAHFHSPTLKYVLHTYTEAHLACSKKPILGLGPEASDGLGDVSLAVLELLRVLHSAKKPQAQAMSDFFVSLRNAVHHSQGLNMSIKTMTDLFISASSGAVQELSLPAGLPSSLFAACMFTGRVLRGFSFRDTMQPFYARVTHDAIYFFADDVLHSCIPLYTIHSQRCSNSGKLELLELVDYSGGKVSLLHYAKKLCQSYGGVAQEVLVPVDITLHDRVLLEITPLGPAAAARNGLDNRSEVSMYEDAELRYVEDWVDMLESCAWECRTASRSNIQQYSQEQPSRGNPTTYTAATATTAALPSAVVDTPNA
jgi:hypothetical protein